MSSCWNAWTIRSNLETTTRKQQFELMLLSESDTGAAKAPSPCPVCHAWPINMSSSSFFRPQSEESVNQFYILLLEFQPFLNLIKSKPSKLLEYLYLAVFFTKSKELTYCTWQCSAVEWLLQLRFIYGYTTILILLHTIGMWFHRNVKPKVDEHCRYDTI